MLSFICFVFFRYCDAAKNDQEEVYEQTGARCRHEVVQIRADNQQQVDEREKVINLITVKLKQILSSLN